MYRETKLRAAIIHDKQLRLLPKEEIVNVVCHQHTALIVLKLKLERNLRFLECVS